MSKRKAPSYFDDDYDERVESNKRRFTFKSFLQLMAYFIIVVFKAIRNFAVTFREKHPIDDIVKNKRRRRRLTFVLVIVSLLIFAIMIGTVLLAVNNENERIIKFNTDAGAVCADYIKEYGTPNYENMYFSYGVVGYRMTGLCYVREMDFDNNGKSELLICYNDNGVYQAEVWGYNDDKFVELYHCKLTQTKNKAHDVWLTIYSHNHKYYIGVHSGKKLAKVALYGMKGDEFVKRDEAVYDAKSELFSIKDEVDVTSFERIKVSVLREEKAAVVVDNISDTIDGFKLDTNAMIEKNKNETRTGAYAEIVNNYRQDKGEPSLKTENGTTYIDGVAFVKLIDLDGDKKDELIVSYRNEAKVRDEDSNGDYISILEYKYTTEVYTFKNKKAKLIYEKEDVSEKNDSSDKYMIIQNKDGKHNLCFNNYSSTENGHVITATSTILSYEKNNFEPIFKAKCVTDYGYKEYFIDDEEVYSSKFEEQGYRVPFFDGSSVYSSTNFDVLYLQRSAGNSTSVETQLNDTKATISKLDK